MLERLLEWANPFNPPGDAQRPKPGRVPREDPRHAVAGLECVITSRTQKSAARLRDLSASGASCLSDLPLPNRGMVWIDLGGDHRLLAQIRWVRNNLVGLKFRRPLDEDVLLRLVQAAAGRAPHRRGKRGAAAAPR